MSKVDAKLDALVMAEWLTCLKASATVQTVASLDGGDLFLVRGDDDTFTVFGSLRDTRIDGGDGFDTLSFGSVGFGAPLFRESLLDLARPSRSSGSFEGSRITGIESFAFAPASDTTDLAFRGSGAGERVVFGNSFLAGASARLALGGGDRLDGGKGPDRFRFQQGFGEDVIAGFRPDGDRLDFSLHFGVVGMGDLSMSRRGSDTLIEVGLGDSILLLDVAPREIDRGDLIFA